MSRKQLVIIVGSFIVTIILSIWMKIDSKLWKIPAHSQITFKRMYKIRVGCSSLTPLHCMFGEVFERTNILKKHGLEGEITFFIHGGDQAKACQANKIDATFTCEVPAIFQLINSPDLRIVASPGSLGRIALIAPKKSNIYSLKDLKNRGILVHEGSSAMMTLHKWLYEVGLDYARDVHLIESDKDAIIEKLYAEEGEAIVSWDPWLEIFLKNYDFRILKERLFWSEVVITNKFISNYSEAIVRYKDALVDAFYWASKNREIVSRWVSARSGLDLDVVKSVLIFNRNWARSGSEEKSINLSLTPEIIENLEDCNSFVKSRNKIPPDFNIKDKILLMAFDN